MSLTNKVAFGVFGAVGATMATKALHTGWARLTGEEPPDPNDPDVPVAVAVAWAIASGVVLAGAQILINRVGMARWQAKAKPVVVKI